MAESTITISEREIISMANAPELVEAVEVSGGRGGTAIYLRFANDCYAEAGPRILLGQVADGPPHLLITQRTNPEGCPDIYQPTARRLAVALPREQSAADLRLIAKPAPPSIARQVQRVDADTTPGSSVEAESIGGSFTLPFYAISSVTPNDGGLGYTITGEIALQAGCTAKDVMAWLFEVPNQRGEPVFDVLAISGTDDCTGAGPVAVALSARIETPQRPQGRYLYVLNEADPRPRPLF